MAANSASVDDGLAIIEVQPLAAAHASLVYSYNERIRPLLDAIDKLRNLMVMKEGIQLPTIVVVGDQSSGKSSVLESLAGISLPRGQGICTRVPLIMRLQNHPHYSPGVSGLFLEYNNKTVPADEATISDAITAATNEIAGGGKGISNAPLTLVVKKAGVPDLTMVDLPGITRVPVHGQPENIYEQIAEMIMEYIRPEESIILNVLSATVDFSTCESIRMSQIVDKTGQRTLAVVTKADKAPEGLLEKVTADDVNIGLGYVCVRNRIGNETYEEARIEEAKLFESHPLLSKIDQSIVGIPVLSEKLMQIQAAIVAKCLPGIVQKINARLNNSISEMTKMPKKMSTVAEAMTALMQIIGSAKETLQKISLRGEYDEYLDDENMHCRARFAEKLDRYSVNLQKMASDEAKNDFLIEEIDVLEEGKGIELPNFIPRTAFLAILQRRVTGISGKSREFVTELWDYIEGVVMEVLMKHCENYPQLQSSTKRAAWNLMSKMKEKAMEWVLEAIEMEKLSDYTCNPEYLQGYNSLLGQQSTVVGVINEPEKYKYKNTVALGCGIGEVDLSHLRDDKYKNVAGQAFDLKARITAYWKVVMWRLVDSMALYLLYSVRNLVNKEMEREMVNELIGPLGDGVQRMLEESPSIATKREKLIRSIKLLKESREIVSKIMDRVTTD